MVTFHKTLLFDLPAARFFTYIAVLSLILQVFLHVDNLVDNVHNSLY